MADLRQGTNQENRPNMVTTGVNGGLENGHGGTHEILAALGNNSVKTFVAELPPSVYYNLTSNHDVDHGLIFISVGAQNSSGLFALSTYSLVTDLGSFNFGTSPNEENFNIRRNSAGDWQVQNNVTTAKYASVLFLGST